MNPGESAEYQRLDQALDISDIKFGLIDKFGDNLSNPISMARWPASLSVNCLENTPR